jgi:hypothetical protein
MFSKRPQGTTTVRNVVNGLFGRTLVNDGALTPRSRLLHANILRDTSEKLSVGPVYGRVHCHLSEDHLHPIAIAIEFGL